MKKKSTLEYPMSTLSAPVKPNDMTTFKQEQKALTFYEQLEGFDSHQVLSCHRHLSTFYGALASTASGSAADAIKALAHGSAFCYLIELLAGPNHPDICVAYQHMGKLYYDVGFAEMSQRCYEECLRRKDTMDGSTEAQVHHHMAEVVALTGRFKEALREEKLSFSIYEALYGEAHRSTMQAASAMERFTALAVQAGRRQVEAQKASQQSVLAAALAAGVANDKASQPKKKNVKKKKKKAAALVQSEAQ